MKIAGRYTAALLAALVLVSGACPVALAGTTEFDIRLDEATDKFEEFTQIPSYQIPRDYVDSAKVIFIFPNYVKGGFLFAGRFGLGVAMVKHPDTSRWSLPAFVRMSGASFGLQAGAEWTDLILIGKGDATLGNMICSRFNWGGTLSVAAGPWGRHMEFDLDWPLRSSLFAYSRNKGAFVGAATEGVTLSFDDGHNEAYYGRGVHGTDVLYGRINGRTPAAQRLIDAVEKFAGIPQAQVAQQPVVQQPDPEPKETIIQTADNSVFVVKKIVKDIKVYFDFDSTVLRPDVEKILIESAGILKRNQELAFAVSGHTDVRGSSDYNMSLGRARAESIRKFMIAQNISEDRIKIISRGELEASAETSDLAGMQKDRYAHFVIAELQRAQLSQAPPASAGFKAVGERMYVSQETQSIESTPKYSTKEHVVRKGDTLWKIAKKELGSTHRWRYIYDLNRDKIRDPDQLLLGQRLLIPME